MRQHLKAKKALNEFRHSKDSFNIQEVKTMQNLEYTVSSLEEMMEVFIPKNLVKNLLKEAMKA